MNGWEMHFAFEELRPYGPNFYDFLISDNISIYKVIKINQVSKQNIFKIKDGIFTFSLINKCSFNVSKHLRLWSIRKVWKFTLCLTWSAFIRMTIIHTLSISHFFSWLKHFYSIKIKTKYLICFRKINAKNIKASLMLYNVIQNPA